MENPATWGEAERIEKDVLIGMLRDLIGMLRDDNNSIHDTAVYHSERADKAEAKIKAVQRICDDVSPDWPVYGSPTFRAIRATLDEEEVGS